jgi:hypothetical protein
MRRFNRARAHIPGTGHEIPDSTLASSNDANAFFFWEKSIGVVTTPMLFFALASSRRQCFFPNAFFLHWRRDDANAHCRRHDANFFFSE